MAKKLDFVYHPKAENKLDEDKAREAKQLIAEFLVKKALQKAAK
ncbi:hypothetical protein [Peribacillus saganii]|nr:hypothetical protein [Peribacillus saganii]